MYDNEKATSMLALVNEALKDMFEEYSKALTPSFVSEASGSAQRKDTTSGSDDLMGVVAEIGLNAMEFFMQHQKKSGFLFKKSELDIYLAEEPDKVTEADFDVLLWWKVNSPRFPILSSLAKDVLVVPVSRVASESAFSTGGRVLDPFRSSLLPKHVQALVCGQDWLKKASEFDPAEHSDEQAQLDKLALDLKDVAVDANIDN
ncbi:hypothetical protein COLO4_12799 [Corchorus olitorius]|uniref:HAT C-terminal dimerisation domain-containing protein n=1 Tax=Corchorus olitorius TaxID=93759 RepID=A0A1R3JZM1_9ROSI|nr:hypothetical protein COLO4_12799 [Corchorus olitorius]